jgi:hypothetical protein
MSAGDCLCGSLDEAALQATLQRAEAYLRRGLPEQMAGREFLFAAHPVFVSAEQLQRMQAVIAAIERIVALPAFRNSVLAGLPEAVQQRAGRSGPLGVFMGYDFHVDAAGGVGLIEVNTNAGGAMLNAVLARAQRVCCAVMEGLVPTEASIDAFEAGLVAMFHREWALAGRPGTLRSVLIVDDAPRQQYLYPEFLLFEDLFRRHGLRARIADPAELSQREGRLFCEGEPFDLVYNRLTDFDLSESAHAVLRQAWLDDAVVLTPDPLAHALHADKRHLALFSQADTLRTLGADEAVIALLAQTVPHTEVVTADRAEALWAARRELFFKPRDGFGSRAAYRGDKLTRRVWQDTILGGDYVAQALVRPGERAVPTANDPARLLKFDLRNYAYDGQVQWVAARLYQGQTTNFRTPGGGFAPVFAHRRDEAGAALAESAPIAQQRTDCAAAHRFRSIS